ncbi:MAG TPA: glycoside hydrolase family 78 protein [Verrucomicrobiae bacterium]|nr:glycoside hydrolase family 78 protein [Verrucomicrobiae bacterium]
MIFSVTVRMSGVLAAMVWAALLSSCGVGSGAGSPMDLTCEHRRDPIGLDDAAPRLSWRLDDARRGAKQTAYRLLVATTAAALAKDSGDLWDSGRVASDQSVLVPYGGKALASRQRSYWKVMVWDGEGKPSPWSDVAFWEMGLLGFGDWRAKWVTPPDLEIVDRPIPTGNWLRLPVGTMFLRAAVDFRKDPEPHHGRVALAADAPCEVFLNGRPVGRLDDVSKVAWVVMPNGLRQGENVVGIRATAGALSRVATGFRVTRFGGDRFELGAPKWACATEAPKNWAQPAFNASAWATAEDSGEACALKQEFDGPRRSQLMRRDFEISSKPVRARAYVTGLGGYEMQINGERVGQDIFTPGWTLYDKRIQYQTYDVTGLVRQGRNAIGAWLGNVWWSSGLGWLGGERHSKPGENLRLLLQLEVECEDGSKQVVVSDGEWQCAPSPILEDTLYHGETYDARLEQKGWDLIGFRGDGWRPVLIAGDPDARLCAERGPSIRVTQELEPEKITEPKSGVYVLDFGQNHPGRPRLTVRAPAGTRITMRHAELLAPDGRIDTINYRSARATDAYVCKGNGEEVWEPRFTYRGFRYMEVTGLPKAPGKRTIVSRVLHTAGQMAGEFECGDALINRILGNVRWGLRSNLHSVPTDCPQRDERLGWMGDAQAFAPTSMWLMDLAGFYGKWMRDVADSQQPNGATTGVCPIIVIGRDTDARSAWADAVSIIPWRVYEYAGDRRILEENYGAVRRWVEYMRGNLTGGLYEKPTWGDWVPVRDLKANKEIKTPHEPVSAAYGYLSTRLLARMAEILGKADDAKTYGALADDMAEKYNAKYLKPDGGYRAETQAADVLPLYFGITPPDKRATVAKSIADDVVRRGGHHTTGFLGTPLILPLLADAGYPDLAWRIVSTDEYPSLGYMVKKGATTIWERWNTDREGPAMNSHNHFAFGSMAQWFFEGLAGLRPDDAQPGFKHTIIRPYVVGDLKWAKAKYPSPYGRLLSHWERQGDDLHLHVLVPPNATATVLLPTFGKQGLKITESDKPIDGTAEADRIRVEIGAGEYRFIVHGLGSPPQPDRGIAKAE